MKLIIVQFDDTVDVSELPVGTTVAISDGTNSVTGGIVLSTAKVKNNGTTIHEHTVLGTTGPSTPV